MLICALTFTFLQAVDLNKKGKDTKQLMYRRLIHTPMEVENVQEVRRLGERESFPNQTCLFHRIMSM